MLTDNSVPLIETGVQLHPSLQGVVSSQMKGFSEHVPWRPVRVAARAMRMGAQMKATKANVTVAEKCMVNLSVAEDRAR